MSNGEKIESDKEFEDVFNYFQNKMTEDVVEQPNLEGDELELKWAKEFSKGEDTKIDLSTVFQQYVDNVDSDENYLLNMDKLLALADNLKFVDEDKDVVEASCSYNDTDDEIESDPVMKSLKNMMYKFLSKESLYPYIKNLVELYPEWLTNHRKKYSAKDFKRYELQCEKMIEICNEFEKFDETQASEQEKKSHLERIYSLMEKVQNYGDPPKELVDQNSTISSECNLM